MALKDMVGKPEPKPIIATICGDAGTGKTSLAATFPKPIFIRAEDGTQSIMGMKDVDVLPIVDGADSLTKQLMAVLRDDHDYKTLVIDSVSALERLFIQEILAAEPNVKSINQACGGYGAGWNAVQAKHMSVRKAAGLIRDQRKMNVIFIAHADLERVVDPSGEDFNRWSLQLNGKSQAPYVGDVDMVAFLRLKAYVKTTDDNKKKVVGANGAREIICHADPATVCKNRFGITSVIDVKQGENPFNGIIEGV